MDFDFINDFRLHEDEGPEAEQNSIIIITTAKWCPLENCTVLVLGSQYGIRLYDWDGSALFYKFDFVENGIGVDEKQVTGTVTVHSLLKVKISAHRPNFFANPCLISIYWIKMN